MKDFIKNIQEKPYEVRMRILWATTIIAAVVIIAIWALGFKREFANLNKQSLVSGVLNSSNVSAQHYMNVDADEIVNGKLQVYFSAKNDTAAILNFSKNSDITLSANGKTYKPISITDRQNQPFVSKILSNSQNFGIMIFDLQDAKKADLTFDNLSFENNPSSTFKEQLNVDFTKLSKPSNIRE